MVVAVSPSVRRGRMPLVSTGWKEAMPIVAGLSRPLSLSAGVLRRGLKVGNGRAMQLMHDTVPGCVAQLYSTVVR